MKKLYILLVVILLPINLISQSDTSGWIDKGEYKEQKLKVGPITFIRFSSDEKSIFTYGTDKILRRWSFDSGSLINKFSLVADPYSYFDLSADETKYGFSYQPQYPGVQSGYQYKMYDLNNNLIRVYYPTGWHYPCPCPNCFKYNQNTTYRFHPFFNRIICEGDFDVDCPNDGPPYYYRYDSGCFEEFSTDSSAYINTYQGGSQKGSLKFSQDGNYTAYCTWESETITNTTKYGYNIITKNYRSKEVLGDKNYNVLKVFMDLNSNGTGLNGIESCNFEFSHDSQLLGISSYDGVSGIGT